LKLFIIRISLLKPEVGTATLDTIELGLSISQSVFGATRPTTRHEMHESSSAHGPLHLISVSFSPNSQSSMNPPSSSPPPSLASPHPDDYSEQSPSDGPTPSYLEFASTPSKTLSEPPRKLLILDLNGTLLLHSPRAPKSYRDRRHQHPVPPRISSRRGRALGSTSWSGARRSPTASRT
jgi:hypothetical protein